MAIVYKIFGNLYRIQCRPLAYLIATEPIRETLIGSKVFADAPHENVVFAGRVERHRINKAGGVVFERDTRCGGESLAHLFNSECARCLYPNASEWERSDDTRTHVEEHFTSECMIFRVSLYIFISSFV